MGHGCHRGVPEDHHQDRRHRGEDRRHRGHRRQGEDHLGRDADHRTDDQVRHHDHHGPEAVGSACPTTSGGQGEAEWACQTARWAALLGRPKPPQVCQHLREPRSAGLKVLLVPGSGVLLVPGLGVRLAHWRQRPEGRRLLDGGEASGRSRRSMSRRGAAVLPVVASPERGQLAVPVRRQELALRSAQTVPGLALMVQRGPQEPGLVPALLQLGPGPGLLQLGLAAWVGAVAASWWR